MFAAKVSPFGRPLAEAVMLGCPTLAALGVGKSPWSADADQNPSGTEWRRVDSNGAERRRTKPNGAEWFRDTPSRADDNRGTQPVFKDDVSLDSGAPARFYAHTLLLLGGKLHRRVQNATAHGGDSHNRQKRSPLPAILPRSSGETGLSQRPDLHLVRDLSKTTFLSPPLCRFPFLSSFTWGVKVWLRFLYAPIVSFPSPTDELTFHSLNLPLE